VSLVLKMKRMMVGRYAIADVVCFMATRPYQFSFSPNEGNTFFLVILDLVNSG